MTLLPSLLLLGALSAAPAPVPAPAQTGEQQLLPVLTGRAAPGASCGRGIGFSRPKMYSAPPTARATVTPVTRMLFRRWPRTGGKCSAMTNNTGESTTQGSQSASESRRADTKVVSRENTCWLAEKRQSSTQRSGMSTCGQ